MATANAVLASIGLPEQKEVKTFTLRFYEDQSMDLSVKYADGERSIKDIAYYYPSGLICGDE